MFLQSPSEYTGEPQTCVVGRVVLIRGPFEVGGAGDGKGKSASAGRGKGKGKGKGWGVGEGKGRNREGPQQRCEVQLLGGEWLGEILYMEAWADGAQQLKGGMEIGVCTATWSPRCRSSPAMRRRSPRCGKWFALSARSCGTCARCS